MSNLTNPEETLQVLSEGNLGVLDILMHMTEGTLQESGLDPETLMIVRIAASATLDAAPASWLVNLKVSGEVGIAPVVGTARIVSAASSIVRALGLNERQNY